MARVKHTVKLTGMTKTETGFEPALSQTWDEVHHFEGTSEKGAFVTFTVLGEEAELVTPKGVYKFKKHATQNYWIPVMGDCSGFKVQDGGMCMGLKVQISLKKMVGTMRYWA